MGNFIEYIIQPTDSVAGIAKRFGVDLQELLKLNPQVYTPLPQAGIVLKISIKDFKCFRCGGADIKSASKIEDDIFEIECSQCGLINTLKKEIDSSGRPVDVLILVSERKGINGVFKNVSQNVTQKATQ